MNYADTVTGTILIESSQWSILCSVYENIGSIL